MDTSPALLAHISVGSLALVSFWLALAVRKGGALHRVGGRVFFAVMFLVVATVGPLLVAEAPVDPGRVVQLVYLSACVAAVVTVGWTSVRWRRTPARFARLPLRGVGLVLAGLGGVVLLAGIATGNPVAVVLSWVGLAFGTTMRRFARQHGRWDGRWWLRWHLDAVCGLLTAVHGTLAFVGWRALVAPEAGPATAAVAHLGVLLIAIVARVWLSQRYKAPSFVFTLETLTLGWKGGAPLRAGSDGSASDGVEVGVRSAPTAAPQG